MIVFSDLQWNLVTCFALFKLVFKRMEVNKIHNIYRNCALMLCQSRQTNLFQTNKLVPEGLHIITGNCNDCDITNS